MEETEVHHCLHLFFLPSEEGMDEGFDELPEEESSTQGEAEIPPPGLLLTAKESEEVAMEESQEARERRDAVLHLVSKGTFVQHDLKFQQFEVL